MLRWGVLKSRVWSGDAIITFFCVFIAGGVTSTYRWHARLLTIIFAQCAMDSRGSWIATGLVTLLSCRFPFFVPVSSFADYPCVQTAGVVRWCCRLMLEWLGEVVLRSLPCGASTLCLLIARTFAYCALKVVLTILMVLAVLATCVRPLTALAALAAFGSSHEDPIKLMVCAVLVSSWHCHERPNCQFLSAVFYAWLLQIPLDGNLLWPALLGCVLPCFPPKADWHDRKEELHRWILQHRRLPKRIQNNQAEEHKKAELLKKLRGQKLWTAVDDDRAQIALQQQAAASTSHLAVPKWE